VISVQINTAQLPSPDRSQDRVFTTKHAAIVLDGATAFTLTEIDAATYADALGQAVADQLRAEMKSHFRMLSHTRSTKWRTGSTCEQEPPRRAPSPFCVPEAH